MERWLLFILIASALDLAAQPVVSWDLGTSNGLPSSMVYDLEIDKDGRVWMGTQNGLIYYDGNAVHRPISTETDGDRSHVVIRQNGTVWCTDFGQRLYEADSDTVRLKQIFQSNIKTVQEVNDTVYVLTQSELLRFTPSADVAEQVYTFSDSEVWAIGGDKYRFSDEAVHRPSGFELPLFREVGSSSVSAVGTDYYRYFFDIGTVLKLHPTHYDTVVVGLHRPGSRPSKLTGVRRTSAGTWIIGYDGAYLIDSGQWFLPGVPVSDVIESSNGVHWFSTLSEGVRIIPQLEAKHVSTPQGIRNKQLTRTKLLPNERVLACDNNGVLQRISLKTGTVEAVYEANVSRQGEVIGHDAKTGISFVGFGDLYSVDQKLNGIDKTELGNFKKIAIDSAGDVLTLSHIETWRIRTDRTGQLNVISRDAMPDSCRPMDLAIDADHNFWLLTACHLYLNGEEQLQALTPSLMARSERGGVWCYYPTDTLLRWSDGSVQEKLVIPSRFHSDQPPMKMISGSQHLVLLYNDQLLVRSSITQQWQRYSSADGLPQTDLTDVDVANGMMAVSSFNGLYLLPLKQAQRAESTDVHLASIRVNGEERKWPKHELELSQDERDLELRFVHISPESRGDVNYHFQLIGPNNAVEEVNQNGIFRLRSLGEGKYALRVYASDAKRVETKVQQVAFTVLPPWYATTPFLVSVVALSFLGLTGIYVLRMRSVRKSLAVAEERNQLLENARTSQLTALRAQLNPHFLFNALNSVQGLFSMGMEEKANEAMGLFSHLMRKLLEHSEEEKISLAAELEMLSMYLDLEAVRFGDDFRFEIDLGEEINAEQTMIPPLLIQPYVENAVKHGLLHREGEKRLKVSIQKVAEGALRIMVADNGIGREAAAKLRKKNHRPFGTKANATRLELLNSMRQNPITVVTEDKSAFDTPTGTTVIISIPLKNE